MAEIFIDERAAPVKIVFPDIPVAVKVVVRRIRRIVELDAVEEKYIRSKFFPAVGKVKVRPGGIIPDQIFIIAGFGSLQRKRRTGQSGMSS